MNSFKDETIQPVNEELNDKLMKSWKITNDKENRTFHICKDFSCSLYKREQATML